MLYRREKDKGEKYGIRPIYFHCDIGCDRTSLIATLYEIHFRGLAPEKALQEMKHFKDDWTLRGLRDYVQKHANSRFAPDADCS